MIVYLDTSALVKLFVQEPHSDEVIRLYEDAPVIGTSVVAFAECMAAFERKYREKHLSVKDYDRVLQNLTKVFSQLVTVSVSSELNDIIIKLVKKYSLRGFDAIHLASALILKKTGIIDIKFVCFDQQLNTSAESENLDVLFT